MLPERMSLPVPAPSLMRLYEPVMAELTVRLPELVISKTVLLPIARVVKPSVSLLVLFCCT